MSVASECNGCEAVMVDVTLNVAFKHTNKYSKLIFT